jgi:hypothetical protein
MGYSGAGGKLIHEKKPEAKYLVRLSLLVFPPVLAIQYLHISMYAEHYCGIVLKC